MRLKFAVSVALAALCCAAPAGAFDFADARRLVTISQPQISNDGTRVVYVRRHPDFSTDKNVGQMFLIDLRTHRERELTYDRTGVGHPLWSPDGRSIAFVASAGSGDEAQSQIFVMPMDGGDAKQITTAKNGVDSFAWSPDGKRFAYVTQDDIKDKKSIDAHLDAFQVHDNDYLHRKETAAAHVWLIASSGGTAHRLTAGEWSAEDIQPGGGGDLSWSPDGKSLAIEQFPTPFVGDSLAETIKIVDVATGRMRQLTRYSGLEGAPQWSPDGSHIAFERNTDGNPANGNAALVSPASGGDGVDVHKDIDRNVDDMQWSGDSKALWMITPDGAREVLWYHPLRGHSRRIDLGALQAVALGNAAKNGTLVFLASTSTHPSELYSLASPDAKPVALTDANRFVESTPLARVSTIEWTGPNGFHEYGVLTLPPSGGKKLPLVLLIHGGPQGASVIGWSSQREIFASHGYAIFEPNYRGGTNDGDRFQRAIVRDTGEGPGKDVMAGLAAVEKLGVVDESRIAVSGWSYGGYMTSWLIGHYHVWKAAVSGASLDDWLDDYNIAFYVYSDVPFFGGGPWDPKYSRMWREQSPIAYAAQATTPTLIMGDIGDNNVPITNSFKLYHALKDNNVPVEFVAFPVSGHFPSDPVRAENVMQRWLGWIDRYLKPEAK